VSMWKTHKIADFVEAGEANIQTGPFGTQLRASDYVESGIPVINVRNIGFGLLREEKLEFVSDTTADSLSNHLLESGDIVFARKGAVERHVFIQPQQSGWMQGSDCIRLRVNTSLVEPRYLSYAFSTTQHQEWMKNQGSHGATMATLNRAIIAQIEFPLPSIPTQQAIIEILSAYDDLIDNNNRRIALLEESVHLLYRKWFVHLRFPGCDQVKMVDGIPEGWKESTVEQVFEITGGGTPSKKVLEYWQDGDLTWYSPSDLTKARSMFMEESSNQITRNGLSKSSARLFPVFSVMMTSRATIGEIAINTTEACTNQGFITCIPNEKIPLYFLYCWLTANVETFKNLATGATFKEISKGVFKKIPILIPRSKTITEFEEYTQPIGNCILNLQRQNTRLREARDRLLPRLMNGSVII